MQLLWEIIGHLILACLLFTLTALTVWYVREIIRRIKGVEVAKHECHCDGCGKRIDQGERVKTIIFPQICGKDITYTYHPKCHAIVMRHVHEVNEFYRWKRKNQKKLARKYKVKEAIRRIRGY